MTAQDSQTTAEKTMIFRKSCSKGFRKDFISVGVKSTEPSIVRCVKSFENAETTRLREKWAIENYKASEFRKLKREIEGLIAFAKNCKAGVFAMLVKRFAKIR